MATGGRPTLDDHHWHPGSDGPDPLEEVAPIGETLHVAETDVGLRVVGEPLQVIGDAGGRSVSSGYRTADADARLGRVVLERRDEIA